MRVVKDQKTNSQQVNNYLYSQNHTIEKSIESPHPKRFMKTNLSEKCISSY